MIKDDRLIIHALRGLEHIMEGEDYPTELMDAYFRIAEGLGMADEAIAFLEKSSKGDNPRIRDFLETLLYVKK